MIFNPSGVRVDGSHNPNWKGGSISKQCAVCGKAYSAKRANAASKFCSLQCVGISQRGAPSPRKTSKRVSMNCEICAVEFTLPQSVAKTTRCCSKACSFKLRSIITSDERNPNWNGGIALLPYPYNVPKISKAIRARDGHKCQSPLCRKFDQKMTTHHIDFDKMNVGDHNLITLCSSCNSRANFRRDYWTRFYQSLMLARNESGGGWDIQEVAA